jgi:hypothetical protein
MFRYRLRLNFTAPAAELVEIARFSAVMAPFLTLSAGQDRVPWDWERRVAAESHPFGEKSYANEVFHQDYGKGIWVNGDIIEEGPLLRYWFGLYNGVMRADNDWRNMDGALTTDTFSRFVDAEMMANGRAETHPFGLVPTALGDGRGEEEHGAFLLAAGLGICWFSSGFNDGLIRGDTGIVPPASGRPRTQQETWAATLDVHLRWMGASLDIAAYWRNTEFHNRGSNQFSPRNKAGLADLMDTGWSLEGGYFILPKELGVFARVSSLDAEEFWGNDGLFFTDGHQRAIRPDATEIGVAANYYFHGERLKFSMDITYVNQQLAFAYNGSGQLLGVYNAPPSRRGVLGSNPPGADNNALWIVRFQLQWII